MNSVLETTKYVVESSKHVKINKDKIKEFCKDFEHSHINHWINESPYDLKGLAKDEKLNFLLVFNSISFSYWGEPKWTIEYNGEKLGGAFSMIVALGRALNNK